MTVQPIDAVARVDADTAAEIMTYETAAAMLVVDSDAAYAGAGEFLLGIKALRTRVAAFFDPHIDRAHKAHKALCDEKNAQDKPLVAAESTIKGKLDDYYQAQRRQREQEAERQRQANEAAERTRRDAEAKALREQAEALKASNPEQAAEVAQVAEAVAQAPVMVSTPVMPDLPRVAGVTHKDPWANPTVEVFDLEALLVYAMSSPDRRSLIKVEPNKRALTDRAKSLKDKTSIPGVRVAPGGGVAAGGGKRG